MLSASPSFQSTRWTLIEQLRASDCEEERVRILQKLCEACWFPLYSYARRAGHPSEDAEDLTQGFFQHALGNDLFGRASEERGRLRALLLRSFQNHLRNHREREGAAKRGAGTVVSIDAMGAEARYQSEPPDLASPEALYHRRWARDFFASVHERLREECEGEGKGEVFERLSPWIFTSGGAGEQAAAAEVLGVSLDHLRVMLTRYRKRYRMLFRQAVEETLDAPTEDEIAREIRELIELGAG